MKNFREIAEKNEKPTEDLKDLIKRAKAMYRYACAAERWALDMYK